ncbi:MAG: Flp pilus assembly protein CpaB [Parvularculaceae bacterium]
MGATRVLVLLIAAGAAIAAAILIQNVTRNSGGAVVVADAPSNEGMVDVLVAAKTLQRGDRIGVNDVRLQPWPEDAVPLNAMTGDAARANVQGAIVRAFMTQGEPVVAAKYVVPEKAGFMSALLEPGMRAAAVGISTNSAASGFILPGDHVDVILTREAQVYGASRITSSIVSETILRDIRVLAVDTNFSDQTDATNIAAKTATLEVTQAEAEMLARAASMGDISLSLRSLEEDNSAPGRLEIAMGGDNDSIRIIRYGQASQAAARSRRQ